MGDIDNFSSVRFLSRHEIGMNEKRMIEDWQTSLKRITRRGCAKIALGNTTHFKVELNKVNKFLKNLPI